MTHVACAPEWRVGGVHGWRSWDSNCSQFKRIGYLSELVVRDDLLNPC